MSAKKDALPSISAGSWAVNDRKICPGSQQPCCSKNEGLHTYGGLAGRDGRRIKDRQYRVGRRLRVHARIGQGNNRKLRGVRADRIADRWSRHLLTPAGSCHTWKQLEFPHRRWPRRSIWGGSMERGIASAGRNKRNGRSLLSAIGVGSSDYPRRSIRRPIWTLSPNPSNVPSSAPQFWLKMTHEPVSAVLFARFKTILKMSSDHRSGRRR